MRCNVRINGGVRPAILLVKFQLDSNSDRGGRGGRAGEQAAAEIEITAAKTIQK